MFWVIDTVGDCPFCWKSEVYTNDASDILSSYEDVRMSDEMTKDFDFIYVMKCFDTMEEVEEYTDGYYMIGNN